MAEVFISHATPDRGVAETARERLEAGGLRCWIAPRDVPAGAPYPEAIADAIASCGAFLVILSVAANASEQVAREAERAVSARKRVVTFRIDDVEPGKTLQYFLSTTQWLNAFPAPGPHHYESLVLTIRKIVAPPAPPAEPSLLEKWMRKVRGAVDRPPPPSPDFSALARFGAPKPTAPPTDVAQSIYYGEQKRSGLRQRGETHVWYFEGRAGDVILATVDDRDSRGGQPIEWEPRLVLCDEEGNELAETCDTQRVRIGPHTLASSGIFSLRIHHNADYRYQVNGTGSYALFLQCLNAPAGARSLAAGENLVVTLGSGGDVHTYAIEAAAGQRVTVTIGVSGKGAVFPALEIYDPTGALIERTHSYSAVREPEPAAIAFTAAADGVYVALAGSHLANNTGTYRLRCDVQTADAVVEVRKGAVEILDAEVESRLYVTRAVHWSRKSDAGFVEDFASPLFSFGEQVTVLGDDSDSVLVESYAGERGYLPKRVLQPNDPKSYFTARLRGADVIGYVLGAQSPAMLSLFTRAGTVSLPILRVENIVASRRALRVDDVDGNVYELDAEEWSRSASGCPGWFVHARWPGIKSAHGALLAISRPAIRECGASVTLRRAKRVAT